MMSIEQLEYLLAMYGVSYVSVNSGAIHLDAPIPLPVDVMNAVIRLTPELARRCKTPVLNAPPAERRQRAAVGSVN